MKTGIVDAVNLQWKLTSACDDSEHVALLDLRLAAGFPRMKTTYVRIRIRQSMPLPVRMVAQLRARFPTRAESFAGTLVSGSLIEMQQEDDCAYR